MTPEMVGMVTTVTIPHPARNSLAPARMRGRWMTVTSVTIVTRGMGREVAPPLPLPVASRARVTQHFRLHL